MALSLVQSTDIRRPSPVLYHLVQTNCCLEAAIIQLLCIPWRLGLVQDPTGLCVVLSHDCHPPETPQQAARASRTSPARENACWCKCTSSSRVYAVGLYPFGGMVKADASHALTKLHIKVRQSQSSIYSNSEFHCKIYRFLTQQV